MPSFPATSDEWTAIIDYFNASSVKESKDIRQTLDPVVKYITNANKNLKTPPPSPSNSVVVSSGTTTPKFPPPKNGPVTIGSTSPPSPPPPPR